MAVPGDDVGAGVDARRDDDLDDRATLVDEVAVGGDAVEALLDDGVALVAKLADLGRRCAASTHEFTIAEDHGVRRSKQVFDCS